MTMRLTAAIKKIFFTATSIYIGNDFIDLAQADIAMNGARISRVERFALSKNIDQLSYGEISAQIDRALTSFFPDENDRPYRVAVNILSKTLSLRRFSMRNISKSEMAQAITFEAQKYIPFSIETLTCEFRTFNVKEGFSEIVFAAAETKYIDFIETYFAQRNIISSVIEAVPILLAGFLSLAKHMKHGSAYIYLHYEPSNKVILCGITNGYPYFFREISLPIEEFAEETKEGAYPTFKKVWPFVERDVSGGIDYLIKETTKKTEKILISGFDFSPEEESVSREFGIPVERPKLSFFKGSAPANEDRYIPGLMLLYDSIQKPFLNMAPHEAVRKDLWGVKSVVAKSSIAFLAILLAHMLFTGVNFRKEIKIKNEINRSHFHAGIGPLSPSKDVLRHKDAVIAKAVFINDLVVKKNCLAKILVQLERIMPPESWVESVRYNDNKSVPGREGFFMTIKGNIFGGNDAGASSASQILKDIKRNKIIMGEFTAAELESVEKKEYSKNVIAEFVITLR